METDVNGPAVAHGVARPVFALSSLLWGVGGFAIGIGVGLVLGRSARLGNLAEWVAGLATTIAIVVAFAQWRHDRVERNRLDERRQAEQVAVWLDLDTRAPTRERGGYSVDVRINNPTSAAIFDCVVWDGTFWHQDGAWAVDPPLDVEHVRTVGYLPPLQTKTVSMTVAALVIGSPWLAIAFTDAAGRYWLRREAELLRLVQPPVQSFPDQI